MWLVGCLCFGSQILCLCFSSQIFPLVVAKSWLTTERSEATGHGHGLLLLVQNRGSSMYMFPNTRMYYEQEAGTSRPQASSLRTGQ
jgi:hypothetical protein